MSRGVNKIMLLGHTGADPDIRATQSGARMARLSLATNRTWTDKRTGAQQEDVQWHNLVCWGKLVDVVEQYVKKGDRLYVEGRIEYSQVEKQGVTKWYTNIVVGELLMLGSAGDGQPRSNERYRDEEPDGPPVHTGKARYTSGPDDDLPF